MKTILTMVSGGQVPDQTGDVAQEDDEEKNIQEDSQEA